MIGRLLCKLGLHQPMVGGWNRTEGAPTPHSVWGGCVRTHRKWACAWRWQFDN